VTTNYLVNAARHIIK